MRTLLSVAMLMSVALPAAATQIPEPGSIALLGVGAVGLLVALRRKK
jgi:threonine dehydrogenase-like Zn-dependent dehydrogenase